MVKRSKKAYRACMSRMKRKHVKKSRRSGRCRKFSPRRRR